VSTVERELQTHERLDSVAAGLDRSDDEDGYVDLFLVIRDLTTAANPGVLLGARRWVASREPEMKRRGVV
jgi:hypothetical protein